MLCVFVVVITACWRVQGGEYCHGWLDHQGTWHTGFQCPAERYDSEEAILCCGSCALRYCCSAPEARLAQGQCTNDQDGVEPDHPGQDGQRPQAAPVYLPFLLVGSVFVSFIIIGAFIGVCCCRCLKPKEETQTNRPPPVQNRLLDSDPMGENGTPSRNSSASSESTTRTSMGVRPQPTTACQVGAEGLPLYMGIATAPAYPILGCPQNAQFFHPVQAPTAAYLQPPYVGYRIPPEHTMVMAPTFLDGKSGYGHPPNNYMQGVGSSEQTSYTGATF